MAGTVLGMRAGRRNRVAWNVGTGCGRWGSYTFSHFRAHPEFGEVIGVDKLVGKSSPPNIYKGTAENLSEAVRRILND